MKNYSLRMIKLLFGLALFAFGTYLSIRANIGLAPWEAFHMGLSQALNISFGNIVLLAGLVILAADFLLKEKIGVATILNTILVGKFVDVFQYLDFIPTMTNFASGILMLLLGQVVICLGTYFYIGAGMGCGPRDSFMVALGKRFPKMPIGAIRGIIEVTVLFIGFLLGAKAGLGTVIAVFGIGFILQITFRILRFQVTTVRHENIMDTFFNLKHLDKNIKEV